MINLTEQELKLEVNEILSKKSFNLDAKDCLLQTMLLIFNHYQPPNYISTTKEQYIKGYLDVLKTMNGCAMVDLEDLNLPIAAMKPFQEDIKKLSSKIGKLELIDGKYVKVDAGYYICCCKGYALNKEQTIFILDEGNNFNTLSVCHHELTHLKEGNNPFPLSRSIPLAFELRKMLYEGHAATNESYLDVNTCNQSEEVSDHVFTIQIESCHSYPLYSYLYKILQMIFGDEILEKLCKNEEQEADVIQILKQNNPNIPVVSIFAHIIYILSCYQNVNKECLEKAIIHYRVFLENVEIKKRLIENKISEIKQFLGICNDKEKTVKETLNNRDQLKREYQITIEEIRKEYEEDYKRGVCSLAEYQQGIYELEHQGTLEHYHESKVEELKQIQASRNKEEEELSISYLKLQEVITEKEELETMILELEEICIHNPNLEQSFHFLLEFTITKCQADYLQLSEEEKNREGTLIIAKVKHLLHLCDQIIYKNTQKKTS